MKSTQLIPVESDPPISRKIWIFAAVLALSLHVGLGVFAVERLLDRTEEDDLGAAGVEIAFELASPEITPSNLPPGPESEESQASPTVVEQKAVVKDVDLPVEKPVNAEDPDRVVTLERKTAKEEDTPKAEAPTMKSSEESVAQMATAPTTIENAPQAAKSTTVDQGTGESRQRSRVRWQTELVAHLQKHMRYPTNRSEKSAQIVLALSLDRKGSVLAVSVATSSGDSAFDEAALAMVRNANPVPPPPPAMADEGLDFVLPAIFKKSSR